MGEVVLSANVRSGVLCSTGNAGMAVADDASRAQKRPDKMLADNMTEVMSVEDERR